MFLLGGLTLLLFILFPGAHRHHLGVILALFVCVVAAVVLSGRTLAGLTLRVIGRSPRAARYAGFLPSPQGGG